MAGWGSLIAIVWLGGHWWCQWWGRQTCTYANSSIRTLSHTYGNLQLRTPGTSHLRCEAEVECCKSPGSVTWGQLRAACFLNLHASLSEGRDRGMTSDCRSRITRLKGALFYFCWWRMPWEISREQFSSTLHKGSGVNPPIQCPHSTLTFCISHLCDPFTTASNVDL